MTPRVLRHPRWYVPGLVPGEVALPAEEAHHALRVLRGRPGQAVELFDGRGGWAEGTICRVGRKEVFVQAEEMRASEPARPEVCLAFAVPKGKRLDWLLEKATELAAGVLQPVLFARSVAGGENLSAGKRNRWEAHCIAAAKQCGLNRLPTLESPVPLQEFLAQPGDSLRLVGDVTDEGVAFSEAIRPAEEVRILVGPEGGFTPAERQDIREGGYQFVRLGATTLRVETAAISLLAGVRAMIT